MTQPVQNIQTGSPFKTKTFEREKKGKNKKIGEGEKEF
jgi:hypothetical protein